MTDPEQLRTILALPRREAEATLFSRLKDIDAIWKLSHAEVGIICLQVDKLELWRERSANFGEWIRSAAQFSYSHAYDCMRDVAALKDMPIEAVAQMPASSFAVLKQLSTAVRNDPDVIKVAQNQSASELVEHVKLNHPNQAIESTRIKRFRLDESLNSLVDIGLKRAQLRGAKTEAEALEFVFAEAIQSWDAEDGALEAVAREGENERWTIQ